MHYYLATHGGEHSYGKGPKAHHELMPTAAIAMNNAVVALLSNVAALFFGGFPFDDEVVEPVITVPFELPSPKLKSLAEKVTFSVA